MKKKEISKNIVITGSSSGIGQALRNHYTALGHNVIGISLVDDDYNCDVSNFEVMKGIFEDIAKKIDKIDILIPCAGFGLLGAVELSNNSQIQKQYDVNVMGTINAVQCALPMMRENGKIINISSVCALFPLPFKAFYCSSKAAISSYSDCLRMELKNTKIQVTAVCPCEIRTNFSKNRQKEFATNERYGNAIKTISDNIELHQPKRMPLEKAIKKFVKIIDKKKLKAQYIIGTGIKIGYFFQRFIPKSCMLKLLNKYFFPKEK